MQVSGKGVDILRDNFISVFNQFKVSRSLFFVIMTFVLHHMQLFNIHIKSLDLGDCLCFRMILVEFSTVISACTHERSLIDFKSSIDHFATEMDRQTECRILENVETFTF
jgi:hypothetical protein